jgi:hypothetical protein
MKTILLNFGGFIFFVGFFCFCLFLIPGNKKAVTTLSAQVSPIQKIKQEQEIFLEPIIFQGNDPVTQKLTKLVKKMRTVSYYENGVRSALTREGGYLSFNEDDQNVFFSYEFGDELTFFMIPKFLTYASGTCQVLREEEKPLTSVELATILNQELLE